MISIVIPLYNKAQKIGETLLSVMNQTFQQFEVILVNDGSTDKSEDVVLDLWVNSGLHPEKIADDHWVTREGRFSLIYQPNGGVSRARNRGIRESQYDYIAFLDADDCWDPDYLETIVDLIRKYGESCDVFATTYQFQYPDGRKTDIKLNRIPFSGQNGILTNYFEVASFSHPPICSINVVVSKMALAAVHGFPVGIYSGEDLLTWARLASRYAIAYSKRPLAVFFQPELPDLKPKRVPDSQNRVGQELIKLWNETHAHYLKGYIGRWFEMRASVYLRLGENRLALFSVTNAIRFGFKMKLLIYALLLFLPVSWRLKIFRRRH